MQGKLIVVSLETKTAIKGSIKKWRKVVSGDEDDGLGGDDCPLCGLFNDRFNGGEPEWDVPPTCEGCPIAFDTGKTVCQGTPYEDYEQTYNGDGEADGDERALAVHAEDMLDYLKGLNDRCFVELGAKTRRMD